MTPLVGVRGAHKDRAEGRHLFSSSEGGFSQPEMKGAQQRRGGPRQRATGSKETVKQRGCCNIAKPNFWNNLFISLQAGLAIVGSWLYFFLAPPFCLQNVLELKVTNLIKNNAQVWNDPACSGFKNLDCTVSQKVLFFYTEGNSQQKHPCNEVWVLL